MSYLGRLTGGGDKDLFILRGLELVMLQRYRSHKKIAIEPDIWNFFHMTVRMIYRHESLLQLMSLGWQTTDSFGSFNVPVHIRSQAHKNQPTLLDTYTAATLTASIRLIFLMSSSPTYY